MPVVTLKELKAVLPPRTRVLGVDHGEKTLGLAMSNPELTLATPFRTLERTTFTENMKQMAAICAEYGVRGFVFGLPLMMTGEDSRRVESVRHYGNNMLRAKDALGFDPLIVFWDERLSTAAMERFLIDQADVSRKKRAEVIDKLAATHILQGALDYLRQNP